MFSKDRCTDRRWDIGCHLRLKPDSPPTLLLTPLRVSRRAYPRIQVQSTLKWNHQSNGIINQLLLTWEHDYKGSSMLNSYHMITGGGVDQLGGQGL
jgi:hypothetical protein